MGDIPQPLPIPVRVMVVSFLSVAHAWFLFNILRRFTTGVDVTGYNLDSLIEWWRVGVPSPMTSWIRRMPWEKPNTEWRSFSPR